MDREVWSQVLHHVEDSVGCLKNTLGALVSALPNLPSKPVTHKAQFK